MSEGRRRQLGYAAVMLVLALLGYNLLRWNHPYLIFARTNAKITVNGRGPHTRTATLYAIRGTYRIQADFGGGRETVVDVYPRLSDDNSSSLEMKPTGVISHGDLRYKVIQTALPSDPGSVSLPEPADFADRPWTVQVLEAEDALRQGDFARAERFALAVMRRKDEPILAMRVYAEARFRQDGFKEALEYFQKSVRPNSIGRWDLMTAISALSLAYPGGGKFLGSKATDITVATRLGVEEKAIPVREQGNIESMLGYCWFLLAVSESGQQSLADLSRAEKYAKGNVAIDWLQGLRLFELGKYKEAKVEFALVSKSDFKEMAHKAKIRIRDADLQIRLRDGGGALSPQMSAN